MYRSSTPEAKMHRSRRGFLGLGREREEILTIRLELECSESGTQYYHNKAYLYDGKNSHVLEKGIPTSDREKAKMDHINMQLKYTEMGWEPIS